MADSTTNLAQIEASQGAKEVTANGLFDAVSPAAFGGRRAEACVGLTWAYYGGRYESSTVANGTLTLTGSTTNYVVSNKSTGAITSSTSTTNWNNTATYARLYLIVTGTATVTSYEDHRQPGAGASPIGRHAVPIMAGAMQPSVTGGCATLASVTTASNQPDIVTLNFDTTTQEFAQFAIPMPKSWDEGTVTFVAHWSHATTTTNFGVAWELQGVAIGNGDAIGAAYGTAVAVTDTGGATNTLYSTPESAAITIAGTPAAEDLVFFRIARAPANGSDTLAIDARLHGITLYITTSAATDA